MNAAEFVAKWAAAAGKERAQSQEHFIDICRLIGEQTPSEADPSATFYTFEAGARSPGDEGFADVWLKGHFAWEYKGKHKDLVEAYRQVNRYREALENPPLLVVCDFGRYEVHTNWTNTETWVYSFNNDQIASDGPVAVATVSGPVAGAPKLTARQVLRAIFENPSLLQPNKTREDITREAASLFGVITRSLRAWKVPDDLIARFVTRVLFVMFATDVGLLPKDTFSRVLEAGPADNKAFRRHLADLFAQMDTGGEFALDPIRHFNGRLFADRDEVPEYVSTEHIEILKKLHALNWSDVEPSIFGTFFERILDPAMRQKLGAHYTSRADIELIIEPVIMDPLRREWDAVKSRIDEILHKASPVILSEVEGSGGAGEAPSVIPAPPSVIPAKAGIHDAAPAPPTAHSAHPEEPQSAAADGGVSKDERSTASARRIRPHLESFLDRLASVTILDPACGSGNFLYVALDLLKNLEKEVLAFASIHGVTGLHPAVHPRQLRGLEINHYAVELAGIVVWIGYLQWKHRNVLPLDDEDPILQPLDNIRLQDAILTTVIPAKAGIHDEATRAQPATTAHPEEPEGRLEGPSEPNWPDAEFIVGNPPFLGGNMLRKNLGDAYVDALFSVYGDRLPRFTDLCCYWFEKARRQIEKGRTRRAGLLATQGIRGGANRKTLERIKETGDIFYAQADRKWIQNGVAVRVSMVAFDDGAETRRRLNAVPDDNPAGALARALPVEGINANLTSRFDLGQARRLADNLGVCFMGASPKAPFDITEPLSKRMLGMPLNPNSRPNSDVIRPVMSGIDLTRRPRNMWTIDFALMSEADAARYEAPFEHLARVVKPIRQNNRRKSYAERWWQYAEARPGMREATAGLSRFVATPELSKHRIFVWVDARALCNQQTLVFARDDDYFFGILHSRPHELWALAQGTQLESRPRYTPTTCFETFPFPEPTDAQRDAIAAAARELNELRARWLDPEPVGGLPMPEGELKKRTLTNLYNQRPTWLANAHSALDAAVLAAYGWPQHISDQDILARLLALNLQRDPA